MESGGTPLCRDKQSRTTLSVRSYWWPRPTGFKDVLKITRHFIISATASACPYSEFGLPALALDLVYLEKGDQKTCLVLTMICVTLLQRECCRLCRIGNVDHSCTRIFRMQGSLLVLCFLYRAKPGD